jgi:hypothetical protein
MRKGCAGGTLWVFLIVSISYALCSEETNGIEGVQGAYDERSTELKHAQLMWNLHHNLVFEKAEHDALEREMSAFIESRTPENVGDVMLQQESQQTLGRPSAQEQVYPDAIVKEVAFMQFGRAELETPEELEEPDLPTVVESKLGSSRSKSSPNQHEATKATPSKTRQNRVSEGLAMAAHFLGKKAVSNLVGSDMLRPAPAPPVAPNAEEVRQANKEKTRQALKLAYKLTHQKHSYRQRIWGGYQKKPTVQNPRAHLQKVEKTIPSLSLEAKDIHVRTAHVQPMQAKAVRKAVSDIVDDYVSSPEKEHPVQPTVEPHHSPDVVPPMVHRVRPFQKHVEPMHRQPITQGEEKLPHMTPAMVHNAHLTQKQPMQAQEAHVQQQHVQPTLKAQQKPHMTPPMVHHARPTHMIPLPAVKKYEHPQHMQPVPEPSYDTSNGAQCTSDTEAADASTRGPRPATACAADSRTTSEASYDTTDGAPCTSHAEAADACAANASAGDPCPAKSRAVNSETTTLA